MSKPNENSGTECMDPNQTVQAKSPNPAVQVEASPNRPAHPATKTPMQRSLDKVDNISKVKLLIGPLRKALSLVLKTSAVILRQNSLADTTNKSKNNDSLPIHHFNKIVEDFHSLCDLMELYLNTAIECYDQNADSARYTPVPVRPYKTQNTGLPEGLNYPEYLKLVDTQIKHIQDVYNLLQKAAEELVGPTDD